MTITPGLIPCDVAPAASPDLLVQHLPDGESVLLDTRTEEYFGLDPLGTRIWELLVTGSTLESARDRLLAEYDVDRARLSEDLRDFVAGLVSRGFLTFP